MYISEGAQEKQWANFVLVCSKQLFFCEHKPKMNRNDMRKVAAAAHVAATDAPDRGSDFFEGLPYNPNSKNNHEDVPRRIRNEDAPNNYHHENKNKNIKNQRFRSSRSPDNYHPPSINSEVEEKDDGVCPKVDARIIIVNKPVGLPEVSTHVGVKDQNPWRKVSSSCNDGSNGDYAFGASSYVTRRPEEHHHHEDTSSDRTGPNWLAISATTALGGLFAAAGGSLIYLWRQKRARRKMEMEAAGRRSPHKDRKSRPRNPRTGTSNGAERLPVNGHKSCCCQTNCSLGVLCPTCFGCNCVSYDVCGRLI